jgi:DNA-binding transcriptional LysR family regulator
MDALTLDQLQVFVTVVEEGSFSAAARRLNRAQSAVTYAVQKLEELSGAELFDRTAYRPALSDAGRALLPRARRVLEEAAAFRAQARGIAGGLEPELTLVVDAMFPMSCFVEVMRGFQTRFPTVRTRLFVETLGATTAMLLDGAADIGVVLDFASDREELARTKIMDIEMVPVCAPDHPLAGLPQPLTEEAVREHVQLVLTDRSDLTEGRDHGVLAVTTWRLADLGAKHAMLVAGLGWGGMPRHLVQDDLRSGRLVALRIPRWDGGEENPRLAALAAHLARATPGPAGRWMLQRLAVPLGSPEQPGC